jgi:ankyrin repeat protein
MNIRSIAILKVFCAISMFVLFICSTAVCAEQDTFYKDEISILTGYSSYFREATPKQVEAFIHGRTFPKEYAATVLMYAAGATPYPEVIDILVKAGCDISTPYVYNLSKRKKEKIYPLSEAVKDNTSQEVVLALLKYGPNADQLSGALSMSTRTSRRYLGKNADNHFTLLLEHGAEPAESDAKFWENILGVERYRPAKGVMTSEPRQIPDVALRMTKAFIASGAKVNGRTLADAVHAGQSEAALYLIESGVSASYKDKKGRNLLHIAMLRPPANEAFLMLDPTPVLLEKLCAANDVNAESAEGTPFEMAVRSGIGVEVLKTLVANGAKIHSKNSTLLFQLATRRLHNFYVHTYGKLYKRNYSKVDVYNYLFLLGFDVNSRNSAGKTLLHEVVRQRDLTLAQALINAGAKSEKPLDLPSRESEVAAKLKQAVEFAEKPQSKEAAEALYDAASSNDIERMRILLEAGMPEQAKNIALFRACSGYKQDNVQALELLFTYGADPNAQPDDDRTHFPLVLMLVDGSKNESLKAYIKAGGNVQVTDDQSGKNLLGSVFPDWGGHLEEEIAGRIQTIDILLGAGIDINTPDARGISPLMHSLTVPMLAKALIERGAKFDGALMYAAGDGRRSASIPVLLEAGANPQEKDSRGHTAAEVAVETRHGEAFARLTRENPYDGWKKEQAPVK